MFYCSGLWKLFLSKQSSFFPITPTETIANQYSIEKCMQIELICANPGRTLFFFFSSQKRTSQGENDTRLCWAIAVCQRYKGNSRYTAILPHIILTHEYYAAGKPGSKWQIPTTPNRNACPCQCSPWFLARWIFYTLRCSLSTGNTKKLKPGIIKSISRRGLADMCISVKIGFHEQGVNNVSCWLYVGVSVWECLHHCSISPLTHWSSCGEDN